ncbi:hypothetical protein HOD96_00430 [Candidatus Falkowbacteria bacterium]|jgi:hypothetical protein|nr:hypothetical protein [Candidatus Falkowbacteria bacterium]MBT4433296.1 hypothetical protein [Candidatus Falkowbacteria bacterium]
MEHQNNIAKFAFFYMLSLVSLVFMSMATGMIIFQIINKNIIDLINEYSARYSPEQLKFAISALIVSVPVYYLTMRQIHKNLFSGALNKDSGVRKWLTYFVLLVSSVVMISWFIGTINGFLDGELTLKFILKSLTAIGIAAIIFSFYLYDIKRESVENQKDKVIKFYLIGSLVLILSVFTASLFFVESPQETRNRKLDNAVLQKFDEIDMAMNEYYNEYKKLPENLEKIKDEFVYITEKDLLNPITEKKIEYKVVGEKSFELCSDFKTSNEEEAVERNGSYKDRWLHESGYQCLKQKVRENNIPKETILRF